MIRYFDKVQKPTQGKKGIGCFKVLLIILAIPILLIGGFIFFGSSELRRSDEEVLKTYQPFPEIADLAEKNTLTDKGRATFYRSNPEFIDREVFKKYCIVNGVEGLACVGPRRGGGPFGGRQIFLLKIDDPRFSDHKYAASIHEMLHVAHDRLSPSEKTRVNTLLAQELSKRGDDIHLTGPINILKEKGKKDKDINSELHSKFGVEYSGLSSELEDYYKQYFTDRTKVVELFKKGGFNSRVRRIDEIRYEIEKLAPQLTSIENKLTAYQNSGDAASFNSLLGQYNSMIAQYNAKAAESQRIYNEIQEFYQYFNPSYKPPENKTQ